MKDVNWALWWEETLLMNELTHERKSTTIAYLYEKEPVTKQKPAVAGLNLTETENGDMVLQVAGNGAL